MTRPLASLALCGLAVLPVHRPASARQGGAADPIEVRNCEIEYERTTLLGAGLPGVVQDCLVRPGDRVAAGQVLGRLQDQHLRAELELQSLAADSDVEVRMKQARQAQALEKLKRSDTLARQQYVSSDAYSLDKLAAVTAAFEVEEAEIRRRTARTKVKQAEAELRLREFVSPHDGVVVAVLKSVGESIQINEPVFRVVRTDRLQVTGRLDIRDAWGVRVGRPVRVRPEIGGADLPVEREVFLGRVVFVDPEIDRDTQTCKVVAEVENRDDLLRSGLIGRMEILAPDGPAGVDAEIPPAFPPPPRAID